MTRAALPPGDDADPLDTRLVPAGVLLPAPTEQRGLRPALTDPRTRTLVLLPLGAVAGPSGMGALSPAALAFLAPAVTVALTVIGALCGMAVAAMSPDMHRRGYVGVFRAAATALLVWGGVAALAAAGGPRDGTAWVVAAALAACAAASFSTESQRGPGEVRRQGAGGLDTVVAVCGGALVLAAAAAPAAGVAIAIAGLGLIALAMALAGWLLAGSSASDREQHTFVAGTLLLLGGAAAYLAGSALLAGLIAGVVWGRLGGAAGDRIARDLQYLQHPLAVLLLVVAGARLGLSAAALLLAAVVVASRISAAVSVNVLERRRHEAAAAGAPHGLVTPAGAAGIAIAVDLLQAQPAGVDAVLVLTAVATASFVLDAMHAARGRGADQ